MELLTTPCETFFMPSFCRPTFHTFSHNRNLKRNGITKWKQTLNTLIFQTQMVSEEFTTGHNNLLNINKVKLWGYWCMKFRLQWCVFLLFPSAETSQTVLPPKQNVCVWSAFWEWFLDSPVYQSLPWELVSKNADLGETVLLSGSVPAICLARVLDFNTLKCLESFSSLSLDAISIFLKGRKKKRKEKRIFL